MTPSDEPANKPYLILTGIPRSGTTLAASLVDRLENTVCLNEPIQYYLWATAAKDQAAFVEKLTAELKMIRARLVNGETVMDSREYDGSIPTNYFDERGQRLKPHYFPVSRPNAGEKLLLAVKHNEPLTSVLPELCRLNDLNVAVMVRHPIPTILSWQSRSIPLSTGQLTVGYRLWPEATAVSNEEISVYDIQAKIYELYCKRFHEYEDRVTVIKYEDLVECPAGVLKRLTGRELGGEHALETRNRTRSNTRDNERLPDIRQAMTRHFKYAYCFYPNLDSW